MSENSAIPVGNDINFGKVSMTLTNGETGDVESLRIIVFVNGKESLFKVKVIVYSSFGLEHNSYLKPRVN